MKRLKQGAENSPQYTDEQFDEIWNGIIGTVDTDRFDLLMSRYIKGKILDIGCFDSPIPLKYKEAIGVDYAPSTIETLSKTYPDARYICADALALPFPKASFNYIVAGEIIEHINNIQAFSQEMERVLKSGGILALSTPHNEGISCNVSDQHVWSFELGDMESIFPWGKVEEFVSDVDSFETIIAFIEKW